MNVDASIFKAYDIRGLYPSQLTAEVARRVGRAFVDYLGAKQIVVGHDARLSSPELSAAFMRGARSQGAAVVDIGQVGTDMMYFFSAKHGLDGGAIITASHNPKEWNGIKMVRQGAYALSGDAGIKEIKQAVLEGRFAEDPDPAVPEPERRSIAEDYAVHCLSFVDVSKLPRVKVVLDTGNGMGAVGAAAIFAHLPSVATVRLNFELDGTFPEPSARSPRGREPARDRGPGGGGRAPISASPGTATPTAASSWTTGAPSCRAISSPPCWARPSPASSRGPPSCTTCAPRAPSTTA